jgi:hypothetical protein
LARLLALEKVRNLIETNIQAGAALYTDHKPGLFESSLSNKGQQSAWRIIETADLQSLVEQHYKQGAKMLLADPSSRIGAPASGFCDPTLPSKYQALTRFLPESIKNIKVIRVYANKDTAALPRHVQAWRSQPKRVANKALKDKMADIPEDGKVESFNSITLAPITTWIGKQLLNQKLPKSVKAQIITSHEKYPDGLMAVPSAKEGGTPRLIVPVNVQKDLVMQDPSSES